MPQLPKTPNVVSSSSGSASANSSLLAGVSMIAAISAFAAVNLSTTILAPVVCALFIIAIAWPMQKRLQSRLPKLIALAIVVATIAIAFASFASLAVWALGRIGRWLAGDAARLQGLYGQLAAWLEDHGIALAGLWAEHFNMRWLMRVVQDLTGRLYTIAGFWLVVVVYVILGLLEVDGTKRKLQGMTNQGVARALIDGATATSAKFRRYLLIRTVMSLATGLLVWVIASIAGLQLALEWGVIAFVLNYIPFIGPFIATVFPTLFALAQFASWQEALIVFVCLNIIQFVIGSYIEPRVAGNALAVSPFVVLLSVFLWTFLWGGFGAFIGVPITIAIVTFCAQHPSSRWLADLLGAPVYTPSVDELR